MSTVPVAEVAMLGGASRVLEERASGSLVGGLCFLPKRPSGGRSRLGQSWTPDVCALDSLPSEAVVRIKGEKEREAEGGACREGSRIRPCFLTVNMTSLLSKPRKPI